MSAAEVLVVANPPRVRVSTRFLRSELKIIFGRRRNIAGMGVLAADAVIHTRASSGIYVAQLLERLGLTAALGAKTITYHDARGAFSRLAAGTGTEIGFGGITEIRRWANRGLKLAGPLPPDSQNYTAYVAALTADPPNPEGAHAFFRFLASADARAICSAHGVVDL